MKTTLTIIAGLALTACSQPSGEINTSRGQRATIWTDPETGCDYISPAGLLSASTPVQPRISADGRTAYCRDQKRVAMAEGERR